VAAASSAQVSSIDATGKRGRDRGRRVVISDVLELEVSLAEWANHAVVGVGAGIDRQRHARTGGVVIGIAVLLAEVAVPGRRAVGATVEGDVGTKITADLDAGVRARDEEEAGAVKRTDFNVFDCLGL